MSVLPEQTIADMKRVICEQFDRALALAEPGKPCIDFRVHLHTTNPNVLSIGFNVLAESPPHPLKVARSVDWTPEPQ